MLLADRQANTAGLLSSELMTIHLNRRMLVSQSMMKTSAIPRYTFLRSNPVKVAAAPAPVVQLTGTFDQEPGPSQSSEPDAQKEYRRR